MKTNLLTRINAINQMLPEVDRLNNTPVSYAGGTFPYYIELLKPIEVKNQYVYIEAPKKDNFYKFEKRYNTAEHWQLDELKFDLSVINRAFKQELKNA